MAVIREAWFDFHELAPRIFAGLAAEYGLGTPSTGGFSVVYKNAVVKVVVSFGEGVSNYLTMEIGPAAFVSGRFPFPLDQILRLRGHPDGKRLKGLEVKSAESLAAELENMARLASEYAGPFLRDEPAAIAEIMALHEEEWGAERRKNRIAAAMLKAEAAEREGNHARVVELMEPFRGELKGWPLTLLENSLQKLSQSKPPETNS